MAYKDEYEVARLYTTGDFEKRDARTASTATSSCTSTSRRRCSARGSRRATWSSGNTARGCSPRSSWSKRLKFLRGTAFDVFGKTAERRMERQLIVDYFATIDGLLPT